MITSSPGYGREPLKTMWSPRRAAPTPAHEEPRMLLRIPARRSTPAPAEGQTALVVSAVPGKQGDDSAVRDRTHRTRRAHLQRPGADHRLLSGAARLPTGRAGAEPGLSGLLALLL